MHLSTYPQPFNVQGVAIKSNSFVWQAHANRTGLDWTGLS